MTHIAGLFTQHPSPFLTSLPLAFLSSIFPSSIAVRGSHLTPFWPIRLKHRSSGGNGPRKCLHYQMKRNRRFWHHQLPSSHLYLYPSMQMLCLGLQQWPWGHMTIGWKLKAVGGRQKEWVPEQLSQWHPMVNCELLGTWETQAPIYWTIIGTFLTLAIHMWFPRHQGCLGDTLRHIFFSFFWRY
jgi:hypothetical protein